MSHSIKRSVRLAAVIGTLWLAATAIVVAQVESARVLVDGMT